MNVSSSKKGFSLIELMAALAIMVIVTVAFFSVAKKITTGGNEMLTRSTIDVIDTALEQFELFGYQLGHSDKGVYSKHNDYRNYKFPPDCRDYKSWDKADGVFDDANNNAKWLGLDEVLKDIFRFDASNEPTVVVTAAYTNKSGDKPDNRYWAGSLAMVVVLNKVQQCRDILGAISTINIKRTDEAGDMMKLTIDSRAMDIYLILDAWGKPLKYIYDGEQAFPIIQSAGADGVFGTPDDIVNNK